MEPVNNIGTNLISQPGTKSTQAVQKKYSSTQGAPSAASYSGKDEASVSESAKILAKAYQSLNDSSEVRDETVDALREQIETGEYDVPYETLAGVLAQRLYRSTG